MNKLTLQIQIEGARTKLSQEFLEEPYRFFTEADAVSRCRQLLEMNDELNKEYRTTDGHKIKLIHQEYPTSFRYKGANPEMPDPDGRRGHYDLVILNSDFIEANSAESITNRLLKFASPEAEKSIAAIIEFKLNYRGWSSGAFRNTKIDLQKLARSNSSLCYAVMLMRYNAPNTRRWHKYWPKVYEEANKASTVQSFFQFIG